jgi:hypothetical protein
MTQPNEDADARTGRPVAEPYNPNLFAPAPGAYGYQPAAPVSPYAYGHLAPQPRNGFGVTALVLGIVAMCFAVTFILGPWVGGPLSVLAIIFGAIGRSKVLKGQATNRKQALWGLSLGITACAIALAEVILLIALAVSAGNSASNCSQAITNALNNPTSQSAQDAETAACS